MRPIDADDLDNVVLRLNKEGRAITRSEYKMLDNILFEFPTIEAEPVKHGRWIDMGDFEQCSICTCTHLKEFQSYYGKTIWIKTPYCPNCGAKMEEQE